MAVWIFFCSPDCPKQPRIAYSFYRFLYAMICGTISGSKIIWKIKNRHIINTVGIYGCKYSENIRNSNPHQSSHARKLSRICISTGIYTISTIPLQCLFSIFSGQFLYHFLFITIIPKEKFVEKNPTSISGPVIGQMAKDLLSRSAHRTPNFTNPEYFVCLLFYFLPSSPHHHLHPLQLPWRTLVNIHQF